jgi:hypothetical protein
VDFEEAVLLCREQAASLLVYKLDRVSRTLTGVPDLLRQGVGVRVATMPTVSEEMLCMLSALGADEVKRISMRTREALAARKARVQTAVVQKRPAPPASMGRLGCLQRQLHAARRFGECRRIAIENAMAGMKPGANALAIMRRFPDSGRVTNGTIHRWVHRVPRLTRDELETQVAVARGKLRAAKARGALRAAADELRRVRDAGQDETDARAALVLAQERYREEKRPCLATK